MPPQHFEFAHDGLNDTSQHQGGANTASFESPSILDSVFSAFLFADDEVYMPPAVNYVLLSFCLSAVGYLGFDP